MLLLSLRRGRPRSRALFENFTRGTLLTVPPVLCHDDGSSTFTLVGTDEDIQAAIEGVPPGVDVTVERIGGERVTPDSAVSQLSARQREAVETAIAVGYYAVPRGVRRGRGRRTPAEGRGHRLPGAACLTRRGGMRV